MIHYNIYSSNNSSSNSYIIIDILAVVVYNSSNSTTYKDQIDRYKININQCKCKFEIKCICQVIPNNKNFVC